ncbi:MAG: YezD family protein [Deinococcota bacterium]|jgi:hypothetical protein|nr:YezD family protein [Deinococcota bacterium]
MKADTLKVQAGTTLEQEILRAVQGIRYGSVEITIHDSKVVQIERKEKVRFEEKQVMRQS